MTDGATEASRDSDLIKKVDNIKDLKERFNERKSTGLAEEIIGELTELKDMKNGYYNSINYKAIEQDMIKYNNYILNIQSKIKNFIS